MRGEILGLAGPRSMVSTILATSKAATLGKLAAENSEPSQLLEEMVFSLRDNVMSNFLSIMIKH